jgi:hypothetical protein
MSIISVYWQSWSTRWTEKAEEMDLANIDPKVNMVNISFAHPDCYYKDKSFIGTGLGFSQSFSVVQKAIQILRNRGVVVMLAVGGATYPFNTDPLKMDNLIRLAKDMGVDGIDIDWESDKGIAEDAIFSTLIKEYRARLWPGAKLSFAGWSTGAYGPDSWSKYKGMNIKGMVEHGGKIDWINIMSYDAGKEYDALGAYTAYRIYYKGPLLLGFQPGKQGWGDAILSQNDVDKGLDYVKMDGKQNGMFIWSYQKDGESSPSVKKIIDTAYQKFGSVKPPVVEKPTQGCVCPYCGNILKITK